MVAVRRWWTRHGTQVLLVGVLLAGAWTLRQTHAGPIFEVYRWLARPFQSDIDPDRLLADARVRELEARLQELEQQNRQLKELLDYDSGIAADAVLAPAIGRSADRWYEQLILGVGSAQGVRVGYAVAGAGGLVGRITSVTPHTSRVLLISDPSSRVGAAVSRSRQMGFIRGQGGSLATLQFFQKNPDVKPGDAIVTSSASRRFPPGMAIGRVRSLDLEKNPAPEATVELTAPLEYLEWVYVHPHV